MTRSYPDSQNQKTLSWPAPVFSLQIELKIRTSQSGLGSGATLSVDSMSITKSKSQKNWEKARERFADVFQPDAPAPKPPTNASPKAWIRADVPNPQPELESEGWSQTGAADIMQTCEIKGGVQMIKENFSFFILDAVTLVPPGRNSQIPAALLPSRTSTKY